MPQVRSGGYGHRISREGHGDFRIYWTTDHKYSGSRLRHSRVHHRDTDEAGARRFAKKHGITFPEVPVGTENINAAILSKLRFKSMEGYGFTPEYIARIYGLDVTVVRAHLRALRTAGLVGEDRRGWYRVEVSS